MKNSKSLILSCILAVLVLPLIGTATDASAQNVLVNPGFESGDLTGWEVFGLTGSSTATVQAGDNGPALPGNFNAFLDNQAEALALTLKQSSAAGSGCEGTVNYSFDLKTGGAGLGGVFFVEIFAEQENGGVIGGSGVLGNYTPAEWTTYSDSFVAPAGTDFVTIQLSAITGAVAGGFSTMHVDNVSLETGCAVAIEETSWSSMKALYR